VKPEKDGATLRAAIERAYRPFDIFFSGKRIAVGG